MNFKHLTWNLTRPEIDMANVLVNLVETYTRLDVGHETIDYDIPYYALELTYHDLAAALGKGVLDPSIIKDINSTIASLSKTQATVYFDDANDRVAEHGTLIMQYVQSSTAVDGQRNLNKRFTVLLNTSLVRVLLDHKDIFERLYSHDRYDLRSKYSTLLYNELMDRDLGEINTCVNYDLSEFIDILDFELEGNTNLSSWTKLNSTILTRSVKELNVKTNLHLGYKKLKDKPESRLYTVGVSFDYTLDIEKVATPTYYDNDLLFDRKMSYFIDRDIERTLEQMKLADIDIADNFRKDEKRRRRNDVPEYKAQIDVQDLLNRIKYNHTDDHGVICFFDVNGIDRVTVRSDYCLMDITTGTLLSNSALESYTILKEFINNDGEYDIIGIESKPEYSISCSNG